MSKPEYDKKNLAYDQIEILDTISLNLESVKNEINENLTNLIKILLDNLSSFFERKFRDYENIKKENDILNSKLKLKTLIEQKLKANIESLQKEINLLKNKNTENNNYQSAELSIDSNILKSNSNNNTYKSLLKQHIKNNNSEVINQNNEKTTSLNKFNSLNNNKDKGKKNGQDDLFEKMVKKRITTSKTNSTDKYKVNKTIAYNNKINILNVSSNKNMNEKLRKSRENRKNSKKGEIKVIKKNKYENKLKTNNNNIDIKNNSKKNSLDKKKVKTKNEKVHKKVKEELEDKKEEENELDNEINDNEKFEAAKEFLNIVESLKKDDKNDNNIIDDNNDKRSSESKNNSNFKDYVNYNI